MKTKLVGLFVVVAVMGLFLSGCGCFYQAVKGETAPPPPPPAAVEPAPTPAPPPPPPPAELKDINFDFDRYNIRPDAAEILKNDVKWFKQNAGKKVKIEGHCDERGTVEYNLALGQRRADSTKSYLVDLGIDAGLLETVSYGKERPVCTEHNESCWAKNRRTHLLPIE
jgi:peptidoglycan-associated lipoprotein